MPPLVALVADCALRTFFRGVREGEAEEAAGLVEAGVLVVAYLLASEASHVALEIAIQLHLSLRLGGLLLLLALPLPTGLFHFRHQVGGLGASELVAAEQLVGVYWSLQGHFALEDVIAVDDLEGGASLGEFLEEFFDEEQFLFLG